MVYAASPWQFSSASQPAANFVVGKLLCVSQHNAQSAEMLHALHRATYGNVTSDTVQANHRSEVRLQSAVLCVSTLPERQCYMPLQTASSRCASNRPVRAETPTALGWFQVAA